MDTIEIKIKTNGILMIDLFNEIKKDINLLKSENGYTFCDMVRFTDKGYLLVKISFPRYYFGNNSYLITSKEDCMRVQNYFCNFLLNHRILRNSMIELLRVDIPFTYIMGPNEDFKSFNSIYTIFAEVYSYFNLKSSPKSIKKIIGNIPETLIYSDSKTISAYNSKVMIYNQSLNLQNKLEEDEWRTVLQEFPDLTKRMRIEVSKRIKRKEMYINEFRTKDIYSEYFYKFRDYILKNLLNLEVIEKIYNMKAEELAINLNRARSEGKINYENFILMNLEGIYDYEILRRAVNKVIVNNKTREGAITTIRRILLGYERKNNLIVLDVYSRLKELENFFRNF